MAPLVSWIGCTERLWSHPLEIVNYKRTQKSYVSYRLMHLHLYMHTTIVYLLVTNLSGNIQVPQRPHYLQPTPTPQHKCPQRAAPPPVLAHTKRQEHSTSTDSLSTTLYHQDTQQALHSHTRACKIPSTQNPPGLTPSGSKPKKGGISLTQHGKTNTPYHLSTPS